MCLTARSRIAFLAGCVLLGTAFPASGQTAAAESPFSLAGVRPGEPIWAPLFRLRAAAPQFARDTASSERQTWLQLLAQAEATFGNYHRALGAWDELARASNGSDAAVRQRYATARRVTVFDTLVAMADTTRVIMINERHHASSDRVLTLALLPALYAKGFRYFAAEAFAMDAALTARRHALDDGSYTSEPVFAEIVREARRLGYTLVPYEAQGRQYTEPDSLTPQQRRDFSQAENLFAATLARDPSAKVLVHAGFAHIRERAAPNWSPMAAYFRARTGIDPVTVDQTSGTERSAPAFAHPVHRAAPEVLSNTGDIFIDSTGASIGASGLLVDFVVMRTAAPDVDGRPAFLTMGGRRRPVRVDVPECAQRHCVLTAHHTSEPDSAAVLDRVELDRQTRATLVPARHARAAHDTHHRGATVAAVEDRGIVMLGSSGRRMRRFAEGISRSEARVMVASRSRQPCTANASTFRRRRRA